MPGKGARRKELVRSKRCRINWVRQAWNIGTRHVDSGRVTFQCCVQVIVLSGPVINAEPGADDGFIVKCGWRPGDAYARIKVPVVREVRGRSFRTNIRYRGVRARQNAS